MMGMFDYLKCEYPLPVDGANALNYQTKDTPAQLCDNYLIKADGSLWHLEYDVEDRSDPNAQGLAALVGLMTPINERWEKENFTGEIRFYDFLIDPKEKQSGWIEFSALFKHGVLIGTPSIVEYINPKSENAV